MRSERGARARGLDIHPITAAQHAVTNASGASGPCKGSCSRFLDDASKDQLVEAYLEAVVDGLEMSLHRFRTVIAGHRQTANTIEYVTGESYPQALRLP